MEKNTDVIDKMKNMAGTVIEKLSSRFNLKERTYPVLIDVGEKEITLLRLDKTAQKPTTITAFDQEPYEKEDSQKAQESLKSLLERNSVNEKEVILTLSPEEIEIFNFLLPKVSDKELKEAIRWKITQLKPFKLSINQLHYTYHPFLEEENTNKRLTQQNTLLFCSPKKTIQGKLSLLNRCGLKAYLITPSLFGLFFWRILKKTSAHEVRIWILLGDTASYLLIEKQGIPLLIKSLSITSQYLTQQIANIIPADAGEAEKLKLQYGLSLWSEGASAPESSETTEQKFIQVSYGLASLLENLIIEIEHTFHQLSHQFQNVSRFDRVFLCGEGIRINNIQSFLHTKLGVPVETIKIDEHLVLNDSVKNKKDVITEAAAHLALTAATPAEVFGKYPYLNFLPSQEFASKSFAATFTNPVNIAVILIGVLILNTIMGTSAVKQYSRQIEELKTTLSATQKMVTSLQKKHLALTEKEGDLLKKRMYLTEKMKLLEKSSSRNRNLSQIFADLSKSFPDEVLITKLMLANHRLSIIGTTEKTEPVLGVIEELKRQKEFRDVNFNYFEKDPKKNLYTFEAIAELR